MWKMSITASQRLRSSQRYSVYPHWVKKPEKIHISEAQSILS